VIKKNAGPDVSLSKNQGTQSLQEKDEVGKVLWGGGKGFEGKHQVFSLFVFRLNGQVQIKCKKKSESLAWAVSWSKKKA